MKKIILLLPMTALLLAACNNGSAPAANVSTINGTAQNYTGGAATVKLLAYITPYTSSSTPVLSSAPISAAGVFSLALPSADSVSPYLSSPGSTVTDTGSTTQTNCSGSVTSSDPTAQNYSVSTLLAGNTVLYSDILTSNTATSTSATGKIWVYFTKPDTFSGTISCTDTSEGVNSTASLNFNAAFPQGWSIVSLDATTTGTASSYSTQLTISPASDGPSTWTTSAIAAQSLNPQATAARNAVSKALASLR